MDSISSKDKSSFGYIIGSSMAIGAIASVIFHVFTKNGEHGEETAKDFNSLTPPCHTQCGMSIFALSFC